MGKGYSTGYLEQIARSNVFSSQERMMARELLTLRVEVKRLKGERDMPPVDGTVSKEARDAT